MSGWDQWGRSFIPLILFMLLATSPASADHDKTDVATTEDGSIYFGEIAGMQTATLALKTNAASTLSIQWRYVTSLVSKYQYRVEIEGGIQCFGSLAKGDSLGILRVLTATGPKDFEMLSVASILPVEQNLWDRFDGSLNIGFTFTNANKSLQYNLGGDITYRARRDIIALSGQSIFSTQEGATPTSQHYLNLVTSQVIQSSWGAFEMAQLQSNPDQGYQQRLLAGGGVVRYFKQSSLLIVNANLGLVYNRENVVDSENVDKTAELALGGAFRQFKHSSHSPMILLMLTTFGDLDGSKRYRIRFEAQIAWEIVGDLTFNIQFTDNYDSQPPSAEALMNDFTIVTSIGYTF